MTYTHVAGAKEMAPEEEMVMFKPSAPTGWGSVLL